MSYSKTPVRIVVLGLSALLLTSAAPISDRYAPEVLRALDPSLQLLTVCGSARDKGETLRNRLRIARSMADGSAASATAVRRLAGLGGVHHAISSTNAEAQGWFDQGLALIYNFNHDEAIRAFRKAEEIDPDCAICFWGEGYSYGPNINAPMEPEKNAAARAAVEHAIALKDQASPPERALIEALAIRYAADPAADRAALDKAFADRMLAVAAAYPTDDDIAVLAAEAAMDTRPWDYWEADGRTPKGLIPNAIALIEGVLKRNPDHAQAAHLYIHLMEASKQAKLAEGAADRLARPLVPGAGHLVHMPSHLYYVLGRFKDAARVNVGAIQADEAYLQFSNDQGLYRYGYYPHNVHMLLVSAQMAGDVPTVISQAKKLGEIVNLEMTVQFPWVQPINAAPYFAMAQAGAPAEILAMPAPDARLPYVTAMWHYARAVALATQKDGKGVTAEIAAIREIAAKTDFKPMTDMGVPAPALLDLAATVAGARLAYAEGNYADAAASYRQAVKIESGIGYQEPPYWYYPVNQSLGAALYRMKDYAGAQAAFMEALAQSPNNGWALYGLQATRAAMGDKVGAAAAGHGLRNAWAGDPKWLDLDRL